MTFLKNILKWLRKLTSEHKMFQTSSFLGCRWNAWLIPQSQYKCTGLTVHSSSIVHVVGSMQGTLGVKKILWYDNVVNYASSLTRGVAALQRFQAALLSILCVHNPKQKVYVLSSLRHVCYLWQLLQTCMDGKYWLRMQKLIEFIETWNTILHEWKSME